MNTLVKALFSIVVALSIIPVSIIGMMWGWGLEPESWGWVAFSYLWMVIAPLLVKSE